VIGCGLLPLVIGGGEAAPACWRMAVSVMHDPITATAADDKPSSEAPTQRAQKNKTTRCFNAITPF
jgi:hypothetical protein